METIKPANLAVVPPVRQKRFVIIMAFLLWLLFLFVPLINSEWSETKRLHEWLTPLDLCVLSSRGEDVLSECRRNTTILESKQPLRCTVGNSWPSKSGFCSSVDLSFDDRKNFKRVVRGYDEPTLSPLKDFFAHLGEEKGAALFIGDSVMQQFFSAIACELEREGVWTDPSKFTNTDETFYVNTVSGAANNYKVPIKFLPLYHFVNSKYDKIANASMAALKKNVAEFVEKHESVYVMINMGLHYVISPIAQFSRSDYRSQMTMALRYLNKIAQKSTNGKVRVFWRETSAQHFPTVNGYWPGIKYAAGLRLACAPINDTTPEADWRNREVAEIVRSHEFTQIKIIPFYELTLPLWDMHVNGHKQDCTHFCWTPMLYQYLFHYMRNSILTQKL